MELAMNTITAESRMGSHNAWMGTIEPPWKRKMDIAEERAKDYAAGSGTSRLIHRDSHGRCRIEQRPCTRDPVRTGMPPRLFFSRQPGCSPARGFGNGGIGIVSRTFRHRNQVAIAAVSNRYERIASQTSPLRALNGRASEPLAEFFLGDFGQPVERRIYQTLARLEFRGIGRRSFPVPGADILADITAKNLMSQIFAELFGNRSPLLNREIGNAPGGIKLVRRHEGVGGA